MIGRVLSHYRITSLLGKGGMGEVYRAEDTKLGRAVALKVLPASLSADPDRLARFVREARTVAGLNHPNIVTLHSVDEADGVHFITLELVDGEPLTALVPEGGLPLQRFYDLAIPMVDAVGAAHEQGVVHRDLKPGNVMVSRNGRVKVLDFGLAKAQAVEDDVATQDTVAMTVAGVTLGTPHYMSPEQVRGEEVDLRADLYALGVVMYEMITGRRPFAGNSAAELFSAVLRDPPPPPSGFRPDLPPGLQDVITRCLAKAPEDRFASAFDVRDALLALRTASSAQLSGLGLTGAMPAPPRTPRRRPLRWLPLVLVAVLVLAVGSWRLLSRSGESVAVDAAGRTVLAVLPFENLGHEQDDYFAVGITDEIRSRLSMIGQLGVISRTSMRAYEGTRKTIREIGRELGTDYILEGTIRWDDSLEPGRVRITPRLVRVADDTQLWSESYEREVTAIFSLQAAIASRIADSLDLTLAQAERRALDSRPTANIAAYQAYLQGMKRLNAPGFGAESFALGVQMFERAVALDSTFALAEARLGSMHARMYHYGYDRSEERLAKARAAAEHAIALQPQLAEAHLALSHYYYWGVRDYGRALEALDQAQAYAPDDSEILLTRAYVKRRQGDFEGAITLFRQEHVLSPRDPNAMVGLGETLATLRRYADAAAAFRQAIDLAPDDPYPYTELALVHLRWRGDAATAQTILDAQPGTGGSEVCRVGYLVEMLGRRYSSALDRLEGCGGGLLEAGGFAVPIDLFVGLARSLQGRSAEARVSLTAARDLLAARLADHPDDHRLQASLGLALAALGQAAEAVRHGERAVALYPLDRDALESPLMIINLAMIHAQLGQADAALPLLEQALALPSILSSAWLEADPRWDPIREDPGFGALLARYGGADGGG